MWGPDELMEIANDPALDEAAPRALVPYSAIYGVPEPLELLWLPNDGDPDSDLPRLADLLPPGTP